MSSEEDSANGGLENVNGKEDAPAEKYDTVDSNHTHDVILAYSSNTPANLDDGITEDGIRRNESFLSENSLSTDLEFRGPTSASSMKQTKFSVDDEIEGNQISADIAQEFCNGNPSHDDHLSITRRSQSSYGVSVPKDAKKQILKAPVMHFATYQFRPEAVYSKSHELWTTEPWVLSTLPRPSPNKTKKYEAIKAEDFRTIDSRATKVPKTLYSKPLAELVQCLTCPFDEDHKKLRALYAWLCSITVRLEKLKFPVKSIRKGTGFAFLKKLRNKTMTHAEFMCRLCSVIDIPCVLIHGLTKGANYKFEESVSSLDNFGQWNAVLVNEEWSTLNSYWGSGRTFVIDKPFSVRVDEFFFLTDPNQLLFSHFPVWSVWQLVENAIDLDDFESKACLKERFFELGMDILSHSYSQILVENEEKEIRFKVSPADSKYLRLICVLYRRSKDAYKLVNKANCSYDMVFMDSEDTLIVKVRFPRKGVYRIEIVGKDTRIKTIGYDYNYVAIYSVVVANASKNLPPFPVCGDCGWGSSPDCLELGLIPGSVDPYTVTQECIFKLDFEINDNNRLNSSVVYELVNEEISLEEASSKDATIDIEGKTVSIIVELPPHQETGICVFVEVKVHGVVCMRNIGNYLVYYDKPPTPDPSRPPTPVVEITPPPEPIPVPESTPELDSTVLAMPTPEPVTLHTPSHVTTPIPVPSLPPVEKNIVEIEMKRIEMEEEAEEDAPMHWTRRFLVTSQAKQKFLRLKKSAFSQW